VQIPDRESEEPLSSSGREGKKVLRKRTCSEECGCVILYVDDLFLTGSEKLIADCKRDLAVEFEMKDLGLMHYFLGLEVWQKDGQIFFGQGKYAVEILKRFGMQDCRPMATPMVIIVLAGY
jgi:hypothetical protein